jgi:hypothetical protein
MQEPDIPEDLLIIPDKSAPPPGVPEMEPALGVPLARSGSVHCELCQGGCACGYDSSSGEYLCIYIVRIPFKPLPFLLHRGVVQLRDRLHLPHVFG